MKKKQIGYLGGTFDPIHWGHINLAIEAYEKMNFDEIWLCPTSLSPHKKNAPPLEIEHRLRMIRLAIKEISWLKLIENEAYANKTPYTYETLLNLQKSPENQNKIFTLVLSEDLLARLHTWYQIEALLEAFPLFIGSRKNINSFSQSLIDPSIATKVQGEVTPIRTLEISSQDIRFRLKNKLYCAHLLPGKVLDYICQHGLY